jgi:hypothetical protein
MRGAFVDQGQLFAGGTGTSRPSLASAAQGPKPPVCVSVTDRHQRALSELGKAPAARRDRCRKQ